MGCQAGKLAASNHSWQSNKGAFILGVQKEPSLRLHLQRSPDHHPKVVDRTSESNKISLRKGIFCTKKNHRIHKKDTTLKNCHSRAKRFVTKIATWSRPHVVVWCERLQKEVFVICSQAFEGAKESVATNSTEEPETKMSKSRTCSLKGRETEGLILKIFGEKNKKAEAKKAA